MYPYNELTGVTFSNQALVFRRQEEIRSEVEQIRLGNEAMKAHENKPVASTLKVTLRELYMRLRGLKFIQRTSSLHSA